MKALVASGSLVVVLAATTGCTAQDRQDPRIDALGQHIVADLKTQPAVADANYQYTNGIDQGQLLSVTVFVHNGRTDAAATNPLLELVNKDAWLTPTSLDGTVVVQVVGEGGNPGASINGSDLHLPPSPQASPDQQELYAKLTAQYGPYRH
jgi:hypothetical protein